MQSSDGTTCISAERIFNTSVAEKAGMTVSHTLFELIL